MARRNSKSASRGTVPATHTAIASTPVVPSRTLTLTGSPSTTGPSTPKPLTKSQKLDEEIANLSIASLTLDTPLRPFRTKKKEQPKRFLFLTLPSELRVKIYEYYFDDAETVLDLAPDNYKRLHKRLGIIRTCRQMHDEITHYFYSSRTFRIFPTHPGRYFKTKKPLLARMKPCQRDCINSLELRLGPGWNNPPRGWVVNSALGLHECINVQQLNVFVECDPSDGIFKGFRRFEGFYEEFSSQLLASVLKELPNVSIIEFDAWSSVKKRGDMMRGLLEVANQSGKLITWGPERGWTDTTDAEDRNVDLAANFMQGMAISGYSSDVAAVA
ncbi:hypothetical protein S7711_02822 [Stachybotrys chartarum IBT 7711]|jgi:hypothetical protein|uniref:F-box domain-containing protein n=1 Tax=Stachybotrys chartarum (strain CBS 109288 / IBT 7711) TaxID=1280523 RepID=A0A084AH39_STACB|nr:hypothetical protein S7711_02822 [Stachybotrys chartarum IBT 7711]KFA56133.1 hypothetical protein S40293_00137 [Stachybotrys chartarum IBT 40293]KFA72097.1 hypothetical protein S40288_02309 [Stachybotrys chartarum IBT 40288]